MSGLFPPHEFSMTKSGFHDDVYIGWLPDGKRLAMRHGPIDLIVQAEGEQDQIERAYQQAAQEFKSILSNLVVELDLLRKPVGPRAPLVKGDIARKMQSRVGRVAGDLFATPMIAVAGAVADHVLTAMCTDRKLDRAYVNNGGDIALLLRQGATFDIGICPDIDTGRLLSKAHIQADDQIGGIATSGWRGRSHSLGIADSVTVLAQDATSADAAATLIANAINLHNHCEISRLPAVQLAPDSDLGNQLVTTAVGTLTNDDVNLALSGGERLAKSMIQKGLVHSVYGNLRGQSFRLTGNKMSSELREIGQRDMFKEERVFA